jgi:ribosomal protein S12 methylthiotransferase
MGKTARVLLDEVNRQGGVGRSFADAPEIDGAVYLNGLTSVKPGDLIDAVVEEADEYDLWASHTE